MAFFLLKSYRYRFFKGKFEVGVARGKFVSGAKVLAAVPSISQPRRVYRELYENEDRLETGGEAVVNKTEMQSLGTDNLGNLVYMFTLFGLLRLIHMIVAKE